MKFLYHHNSGHFDLSVCKDDNYIEIQKEINEILDKLKYRNDDRAYITIVTKDLSKKGIYYLVIDKKYKNYKLCRQRYSPLNLDYFYTTESLGKICNFIKNRLYLRKKRNGYS